MLETADIFLTGGCGTFGSAFVRRRALEKWSGRLTIYSTDPIKHERMRRKYPDINFVQGDIRSESLYGAMVGHAVVIHAAAVKVIPTSEHQPIDTYDVNVNGSLNVCACAVRANVKHVLGISTDKVCHAANAYGATKYLMEKVFQEYANMFDTQFHLVRFGNVLESNGSVIQAWKQAVENGERIKITDPNMTRFWLSPDQAVQYVIEALKYPSGMIFIPKIKALSIGKLAEYTVGDASFPAVGVPIRPGEKIHETLLTEEEGWHAHDFGDHFLLAPTTYERYTPSEDPYTSNAAPQLTRKELLDMLETG